MTVAGLKEANLQHRNEIRHTAFVSDTEKCWKKLYVLCSCGLSTSLLDLKAGMVLPSMNNSDFWMSLGK